MLLLSRKEGERVRIQCPNLDEIWLTMHAGHIALEHKDGGATIWPPRPYRHMVKDDTITIMWIPRKKPYHNDTIGIDAPLEYAIDREEVIKRKPEETT